MKGLKGLKNILREANKKLKSKNKVESGKITVRLVDPNRLGCYP
jgi:hypothetical protein